MYSFVVLGQIPGTSITISFTMWIQLALLLAAVVVWYKYARKHKFTTTFLTHPNSIMVMRNGRPVPAEEISL